MANDTKNFKVSEFTCHCGCNYNIIDQRVMNIAQKIRDSLGVPVRVNSGCRCKTYNATIPGAAKNSYHTQGLAADLSCSKGGKALFLATQKLWNEGLIPELRWCKYYVKKNFVHIDCGKKRNNIFAVGD